jgi:hypothetical protein
LAPSFASGQLLLAQVAECRDFFAMSLSLLGRCVLLLRGEHAHGSHAGGDGLSAEASESTSAS